VENRSHALIAGLFALGLCLFAIFAVWWFGGKHEATKEYTVVTRQNVTGLSLQGQVRYRGIRVGKVLSIALDPQDSRNILIRIAVDSAVPVTGGTTAKLGYQGVTGIAHVLLEETGSDPRPLPAGEGASPRIAMQSSLIQELSDTGGETLRQARELLASANDFFDDENRQRLTNILSNLETATGNAGQASDQLRRWLTADNQRSLTASLARIEQATHEVGPLLVETRRLMLRLQGISERIDKLVADPSPSGIAALPPRLNELGSELSASSRQLNRVLQRFEESPQSFVLGWPERAPGPGEPGFVAPPWRPE